MFILLSIYNERYPHIYYDDRFMPHTDVYSTRYILLNTDTNAIFDIPLYSHEKVILDDWMAHYLSDELCTLLKSGMNFSRNVFVPYKGRLVDYNNLVFELLMKMKKDTDSTLGLLNNLLVIENEYKSFVGNDEKEHFDSKIMGEFCIIRCVGRSIVFNKNAYNTSHFVVMNVKTGVVRYISTKDIYSNCKTKITSRNHTFFDKRINDYKRYGVSIQDNVFGVNYDSEKWMSFIRL